MLIHNHEFTFGADPELFVKRDGKLVSGYDLIPGTKTRPFPVKHGAVQVDGMALEFNIDPANDYAGFERNLVSVQDQLMKMIPGYEFFVEPVAAFGSDYIESQPDIAKDLGCNPDFNAYTGETNPAPAVNTPFRTASGHIHIGWTRDVDPFEPRHFEACCDLVKILDIYVGVPLLTLYPASMETDEKLRRDLYGKAGAFRPKSYGLEYRVPSNLWIKNPVTRKFVFDNTVKAINKCFENPNYGSTFRFSVCSARELINEFDTLKCLADRNHQPAYMEILENLFYSDVGLPKPEEV